MKTRIKKLPQSQVEIEAEIPARDFENFFEQAISKAGQNLTIPGFRKGKAPREIIVGRIGQDSLLMEAAELAIRAGYKKIIQGSRLEPISQPRVTILKLAPKNPFCFKASFFVLPRIELPDCKSITSKIKRKEVSVETSELKDTLSWLQKSRARFKKLKREAQKGDFVEIEFSSPQIGSIRSKEVDTRQLRAEKDKIRKDAFILGKGYLIPGLEQNLEGMKEGEEKNFSIAVPKKHFQKKIAGKTIEIFLKMVAVKQIEFPEINDQFARGLGKFENLAGLKKGIKEGLRLEKKAVETQRIRQKILETIEKNCQFEIPPVLVETEKQRMVENLKQKVKRDSSLSWQEYLEKIYPVKSNKIGTKQFDRIKEAEKNLLESFEAEARKRIKKFLIIREIAKKENIEVSAQEVKKEVNQILKNYPDVLTTQEDIDPVKSRSAGISLKTGKKLFNRVDLEKLKDYTKERIRTEKTLAKLESYTRRDKA
jgi:trigger factor